MPEIPDRFAREDALTARMEGVLRGVRGRLRRGEAVDWGDAQARLTRLLTDEMVAVYSLMFLLLWRDERLTNYTPPSQDAVALAALAWASPLAEATAGGLLDEARRRSFETGGRVPAGVDTGLERPRSERIAITEITRAGTQGERAAVGEIARTIVIDPTKLPGRTLPPTPEQPATTTQPTTTQPTTQEPPPESRPGRTLPPQPPREQPPAEAEFPFAIVAKWITVRDDRVCPVCEPLHGKYEAEWRQSVPSGPPAHPRCRCHLEYEFR